AGRAVSKRLDSNPFAPLAVQRGTKPETILRGENAADRPNGLARGCGGNGCDAGSGRRRSSLRTALPAARLADSQSGPAHGRERRRERADTGDLRAGLEQAEHL